MKSSKKRISANIPGMANGGANPHMLGIGMARDAGIALATRGGRIESALSDATGAQTIAAPAGKGGMSRISDGATPPTAMLAAQSRGMADGGMRRGNAAKIEAGDGGTVKGPGGPTDDQVGPVALANTEYVLPGDTVEAMGGAEELDKIRDATHEFVDEKKRPDGIRGLANGQPHKKNFFDNSDVAEATVAGVGVGSNAYRQQIASPNAAQAQFTDAQRVAAAAAANPAGSPRTTEPRATPAQYRPRSFDGPLNPASQRRIDAFDQRPAPVTPAAPTAAGMNVQPGPAAAPRPAPEPGKMNYVKDLAGRGMDAARRMRPGNSATAGVATPAAAPNFIQRAASSLPGAGPAAQKVAAGAVKTGIGATAGTAKLASRIAGPLTVANEGSRVYDAIVDPTATKMDVAKQGARSVTKLGAAAAGAQLGLTAAAVPAAASGPFAPLVLGGGAIIGGGLGYFGADKLLPGQDRESFLDKVVNEPSPADRARAEQMRGAKGPAAMPTAQAPTARDPYTQGAGLPSAEQVAADRARVQTAEAKLPTGIRGANGTLNSQALVDSTFTADNDALLQEQATRSAAAYNTAQGSGRFNDPAAAEAFYQNRTASEFSPGMVGIVNKGIRARQNTPQNVAADNARFAMDGHGGVTKSVGKDGRVSYGDSSPNPFLGSKFSNGQTGQQSMDTRRANDATNMQEGLARAQGVRDSLAEFERGKLQAAALGGSKEAAVILAQQGKDAADVRVANITADGVTRTGLAKAQADMAKAAQEQKNFNRGADRADSAEFRASGNQRRAQQQTLIEQNLGPAIGADKTPNTSYNEFAQAMQSTLAEEAKRTKQPVRTLDDVPEQELQSYLNNFSEAKKNAPGDFMQLFNKYLRSKPYVPGTDLNRTGLNPAASAVSGRAVDGYGNLIYPEDYATRESVKRNSY